MTHLDIVNPVPESPDPTQYKSEKTGRGPLEKGWIQKTDPIMCAYKLVGVNFKYFGFQTKVENTILSVRETPLSFIHIGIVGLMGNFLDSTKIICSLNSIVNCSAGWTSGME